MRGAYADVLDALTQQLHHRAANATATGDSRVAVAVPAADFVEDAKLLAAGNESAS
ncbi:MAG: hypothetical protein U0163_18640 [Gemmatimonadaceae bacterium]